MKKLTIKFRYLGSAVFTSAFLSIIVLVLAILQIVTTYPTTYAIAGVAIVLFVLNLIAIPEYKKYILEFVNP